jgi:hypothetical protein
MARAISVCASAAIVLALACPSFEPYECETFVDCNRDGVPPGECLHDGACAYPDNSCPSGLRRSPYAASRPRECVDESDTADTAVAGCDLVFAYRREIEVAAAADIPAGYSLSIEIDHAALVAAGKARADGEDVRVFHEPSSGECTELDRIADPRASWDRPTTRIWFAAPAAVVAGARAPGLRLEYGRADADSAPADWNDVFIAGSDFEIDGPLPPGLVASVAGTGDAVVEDGKLVVSYGSFEVSEAAIAVLADPLPADRGYEFVNRARLVSGGDLNANTKYLAVVTAPERPEVAHSTIEGPRRLLSAQHRTSTEQYIGWASNAAEAWYWTGAAWSLDASYWGSRGLSEYTTHVLTSTMADFVVQAWDDAGTQLTETAPVPWSSVLDLDGDDWLYMGEVFTDYDVCVAHYDWFFLRRFVRPEPAVTLAPET